MQIRKNHIKRINPCKFNAKKDQWKIETDS